MIKPRLFWLEIISLIILYTIIPLIEGGTNYLSLMLIRISVLALVSVWWIRQLKEGKLFFQHSTLDWWIIGLLIIALFSFVFRSPYKDDALRWLFLLIVYALLFWYLRQISKDDILRNVILISIYIQGAFQAILIIIQAIVLGYYMRPSGTFFNTNFAASYLVILSAYLLAHLLWSDFALFRNSLLSYLKRYALKWLLLLLLLIGIITTASRGALFALLVSWGMIFFYRKPRLALIVLVILIILVVLVPNPLQQRLKHLQNRGDLYTYARLDIWRMNLKMFSDYWLMGVGIGMYKYYSPYYNFPIENTLARYSKVAKTVHNEYLQWGTELGIVFVLWLISLFIFISLRIYSSKKKGTWNKQYIINLLGFGSGIIAFAIHCLVDSVFHNPTVVILMLTFLSYAWNELSSNETLLEIDIPSRQKLYYIVSSILILLLLYISLQQPLAYFYFDASKKILKEDRNKAEEYIKQAININPANAIYPDVLGYIYAVRFRSSKNLDDWEKSIEYLTLAGELNPIEADYKVHLAQTYYNFSSYFAKPSLLLELALENYDKASKLEPYNVFHINTQGIINLQLQRQDIALEYFTKAIELEPHFFDARFKRALCYENMLEIDKPCIDYIQIRNYQKDKTLCPRNPYEEQLIKIDNNLLLEKLEMCERNIIKN